MKMFEKKDCNDVLCLKRNVRKESRVWAEEIFSVYHNAVKHLEHPRKYKKVLMKMYRKEYGQRFRAQQVVPYLYKFFLVVYDLDYQAFINRFSLIDNKQFVEGWYFFDVMGQIVLWLKEYFPDERYISCLEKLFQARLESEGKATDDLTECMWEGDAELFFDLGKWYIEKDNVEDNEKGVKYLVEGFVGDIAVPCFELHIKWLKTLYLGAVKTNHTDSKIWENLAAEMRDINEYRRFEAFDKSMIEDCENRIKK